jgi:hypothetical protein
MEFVVYLNLALSLALGLVVALVAKRAYENPLAQLNDQVIFDRFDMAVGKTLPAALRATVEEHLRRTVEAVFDDRLGRLADLSRDLKQTIHKEIESALADARLHERIEQLAKDKLARGALNPFVKEIIDEHYRDLSGFLENEVVPKALEKSGAIRVGAIPKRAVR